MEIKKHRVFFNVAAEEKWLDSLGKKGLLLVGTAPFTYYFEQRSGEWTYSVEWLDSSPLTPENAEYIRSRTGRDVYCGSKNCYVYFASSGECAHSHKNVQLTQRRYFRIAAFWAVIAALMAGLLVYNIVWAGKFKTLDYVIGAKDSVPGFMVGRNPAHVFLWFVIPLTVAALLVFAYCALTAAAYKRRAAGYPVTVGNGANGGVRK